MQCQQFGITHLEFLHLSWPAEMQNPPVLRLDGIRLEEQWLLADQIFLHPVLQEVKTSLPSISNLAPFPTTDSTTVSFWRMYP